MSRELTTYIIYYEEPDGTAEGFEVYGTRRLREAMKWLHKEVKAPSITVYKHGKNFDENHDDVIEMTQYWK